ncbi:hypothetical protein [Singulisphaera acidiphila]|uniref:Uncharacterized protein n=1 Tax=Singulisphaera acidiphila (strain ATCC BAA-1392 / DSM 18658 / VKM B-2454 / MOB10) TaxID=886293 RepID=L0DPW2_SINAD|nr:hypothetical protein [Singulisphaera acidiphila]AGA30860.1 hypothetical protein Sinac_6794 [Singulisphaera acidiphila DSM 18658]
MRIGMAAVVFLGLTVMVSDVGAQTSDAALRDRVLQLVDRLGAPKLEARKAAEEALIKLGPRILPLLPEAGKAKKDERSEGLERVRAALLEAQNQDPANLGAAKVTIKGTGIRLTEVIKALQTQSGNVLTDLREQEGAEATNPPLDLDITDKPFLEALDIIARKAELTPNFYTGDGSIGLMAGIPPSTYRVLYSGPFRITLRQIGALRDFQADTTTANVQLEVAWEPRLRPMLLALKADQLAIIDDMGKTVEPQVMAESTDVPLRPDNPVAELNINLDAPDRAAKKLASLKVKADVTIPAGLKTFRFPSLAAENVTKKEGEIAVTLEGTEIDEQVWKVNVELSYPSGGAAFESYRQGLFNNRLWLQKADGSRFEHNGGFSNTAAEGDKLGFEYLFVDAPGKPADYQLVYETPSKVLTIPLEFEFKDVPLP